MTNKSLCSIADEYLYGINPLAQRIGEEVTATKEAYEGLWHALSPAEKNQAIDETIIQPEVAVKYTLKNVQACKELPEWYPKLRIQTGLKYVIDETGSTLRWRDEHSAPFSFMTRSQMNLNLSEDPDSPVTGSDYRTGRFDAGGLDVNRVQSSPDNDGSDQLDFYPSDSCSDGTFETSDVGNSSDHCASVGNSGVFAKLINKTSLLKISNNRAVDDDNEILVPHTIIPVAQKTTDRHQMSINLKDARPDNINESTSLLDTPSSYDSFRSSRTDRDDAIPKTGFEFLDNW